MPGDPHRDPHRPCGLVVAWSVGQGRASGTKGPIMGREVDGKERLEAVDIKDLLVSWLPTTAGCLIAGLLAEQKKN